MKRAWSIRLAGACFVLLGAFAPLLRGQEALPEPARSGVSAPDFDSWRAGFGARLDQTIAGLQTQGAKTSGLTLERVPIEGTPEFISPISDSEKGSQFSILAGILREKGLPASLLGVAAVESGFDPGALSPKGARGLWQLMPATARRYGLVVQPQRDERTDPIRSTYAAAKYMKDLFGQFGNWPLALAAYNAGEDRIARALSQAGVRDFWTLRELGALPEETLRYVPKVLSKVGGEPRLTESSPTSLGPGALINLRPPRLAPALPVGQEVFATTTPLPAGSPLVSQ